MPTGRRIAKHEHHLEGEVFVGRPLVVGWKRLSLSGKGKSRRKASVSLSAARKRDVLSIANLKNHHARRKPHTSAD